MMNKKLADEVYHGHTIKYVQRIIGGSTDVVGKVVGKSIQVKGPTKVWVSMKIKQMLNK